MEWSFSDSASLIPAPNYLGVYATSSHFLKNVNSNDFFRKSIYKNDASIFKCFIPLFSGSEVAKNDLHLQCHL